jgi:hypothetical protein
VLTILSEKTVVVSSDDVVSVNVVVSDPEIVTVSKPIQPHSPL